MKKWTIVNHTETEIKTPNGHTYTHINSSEKKWKLRSHFKKYFNWPQNRNENRSIKMLWCDQARISTEEKQTVFFHDYDGDMSEDGFWHKELNMAVLSFFYFSDSSSFTS